MASTINYRSRKIHINGEIKMVNAREPRMRNFDGVVIGRLLHLPNTGSCIKTGIELNPQGEKLMADVFAAIKAEKAALAVTPFVKAA